jgi:hypothetical protein
MSRLSSPVLFSDHFGISAKKLNRLGVLDIILNVDTKVFIDPLLLSKSNHPEFRDADQSLLDFFEIIVTLLERSNGKDLAYRTAVKRFLFKEISGTCIGHGAGIHGQGWGPVKASKVCKTAREIIKLGIDKPELFCVIPLIEDDIGPDLISDMVTNIAIRNIIAFNNRVLKELGLSGLKDFTLKGQQARLLKNPCEATSRPIILLPTDILRDLPIANDWSEVCMTAEHNAQLRDDVNAKIGEIWKNKTKDSKRDRREKVLANKDAFQSLLDVISACSLEPYDFENDPQGLRSWMDVRELASSKFPLPIKQPKKQDLESMCAVVEVVIKQFEFLVEERGLSTLLWKSPNNQPHKESVCQHIFYAVADSYMKANNIDITPEASIGYGSIDFKFSVGNAVKAVCEVKLSTNPNVVLGYERQLEIYKKAEETEKGFFILIDVGKMGKKLENVEKLRNKRRKAKEPYSPIYLINGQVKASPSKKPKN